jgi:hypothetical protein
MSAGLELDRFLADLGARRERLLRLAEPTDAAADLLQELRELSEQLIVADEELRVQQEELDAARRSLLSLSTERDLLLMHSSRAYVLTDDRGGVLQATGAVHAMIRQSPVPVASRPIATWFLGTDRRAVRSMITDLHRTGEPQRTTGARLAGDGQPLVDITAEPVASPKGDRSRIRWELIPTEPGTRRLQLVPDSSAQPVAATRHDPIIVLLAEEARELDACATWESLLQRAVEATVRLVPGARHAGLVLAGRHGRTVPVAATNEVATMADLRQLERGVGPVAEALSSSAPVLGDLEFDSGDEVEPARPATGLSVPLVAAGQRLGVLTAYAETPGGLDEHARPVARALGTEVALALHRHIQLVGLREAIQSRQLIGQAVGVLMERHRLTADDAFAVLSRSSQNGNVKLRELARNLLRTGQIGPEPPQRPES